MIAIFNQIFFNWIQADENSLSYWSNVRKKKLAVFWFFEVLPGLSQVNQITEDPHKQSLKICIKCCKS